MSGAPNRQPGPRAGREPARERRAIRRILHDVETALVGLIGEGGIGEGGGRPLIVALSGGCDSSALLFCLADLQERVGWRPHAVHVDHGIASAAVRRSFRETAAAAAEIAQAPLEVVSRDAVAERRAGGGPEAAARRVRYAALAERAEALGATVVATAHTRNDQAETVLARLIRGAGLDGLAGIPALGQLPGAPRLGVVRPLLGLTRNDTEAVCRAWGFEPVEDPSNADLTVPRNRIRAETLPLLRRTNPQVDAALARLAEQAGAERAFLETLAAAAAGGLGVEAGPWSRNELLEIAAPLRPRVVRWLAARSGLQLTAERTQAALEVIERGHGRAELGEGWTLRVGRGRVCLEGHSGGC